MAQDLIDVWGGELLSLQQVAEKLGRHSKTVARWARSGRLATVKIGGRYLTSRQAIEKFVYQEKQMKE
jgi:excisionase family DNA binding protein